MYPVWLPRWTELQKIALAKQATLTEANGNQYATIREVKPFAKVVDALLGELPFVGLVCNYIFNPSYTATSEDGTELFRLTKVPSF